MPWYVFPFHILAPLSLVTLCLTPGKIVPGGSFSAQGSLQIPSEYLNQIPSIVYSVPDLDGVATIKLIADDTGKDVACVQSGVSNGKTTNIPAVTYVAAGVAGAALILAGLSALGSVGGAGGGAGGHGPLQPSLATILGWLQSMSMDGMASVNYPSVYRSFAKNFAFSTGLIPWSSMQIAIDDFRAATGGNLTDASVQYLQNVSLAFTNGQSNTVTFAKRSIDLVARAVNTTVNGTGSAGNSGGQATHIVYGLGAYVEQLLIPQANAFMTALLIFALLVGALTCSILFVKVILEVTTATHSPPSPPRGGFVC